jgi:hypothetical protein
MKIYRQGDVLFKEIKAFPKAGTITKVRTNGHILEGEVTGHIHQVAESNLEDCELMEVGEGLVLNVSSEGGISIVHPDHRALNLPAGRYEILRQREYSPEAIRNVCD